MVVKNCFFNLLRSLLAKTFNLPDCFCPVCNQKFKKFNPLPDFYRENGIKNGFKYRGTFEMTSRENYSCSICGASDRERLYAHFIKQNFNGKEEITFYHFSPEKALQTVLIKKYFKNINYKTFDLLSSEVDIQADLMDLNMLDNNVCDFFICSHILEHIENDRKAISELYRITKPNGIGILMVPISLAISKSVENIPNVITDEDRWKYYGQNDHVRLYAKTDFIERIRETGFTLLQYDRQNFGKMVFRQMGQKPTAVLYIVKKEL